MQRDELYTDIGVGLSTLLVSTNRAMREPLECGTSDRTGSTFFYVYIYVLMKKTGTVRIVGDLTN